MKNIESVMAADKRPYFQSATYYYENNKDMKQALTWVNKAIEQNPKAYWAILLKAKIQVELKDITGANSSAQKVVTLAQADDNADYVKMEQTLMTSIKKAK